LFGGKRKVIVEDEVMNLWFQLIPTFEQWSVGLIFEL